MLDAFLQWAPPPSPDEAAVTLMQAWLAGEPPPANCACAGACVSMTSSAQLGVDVGLSGKLRRYFQRLERGRSTSSASTGASSTRLRWLFAPPHRSSAAGRARRAATGDGGARISHRARAHSGPRTPGRRRRALGLRRRALPRTRDPPVRARGARPDSVTNARKPSYPDLPSGSRIQDVAKPVDPRVTALLERYHEHFASPSFRCRSTRSLSICWG